MLLLILIFLFVFFRWKLLEPIIGTLYMYVFDSIMWVFFAATTFATPSRFRWLDYLFGSLSLIFAFIASLRYASLDKKLKEQSDVSAK